MKCNWSLYYWKYVMIKVTFHILYFLPLFGRLFLIDILVNWLFVKLQSLLTICTPSSTMCSMRVTKNVINNVVSKETENKGGINHNGWTMMLVWELWHVIKQWHRCWKVEACIVTSLGIRVLGITLHRDSKMTNYIALATEEATHPTLFFCLPSCQVSNYSFHAAQQYMCWRINHNECLHTQWHACPRCRLLERPDPLAPRSLLRTPDRCSLLPGETIATRKVNG
jgi:hypothetical protein